MAAASLCGALWAGVATAIHLGRRVHEVLATLLHNFVALLDAREPLWVVPAALAVGFLETGGQAMQRQTGVPSALVVVIEGLTMLFVLAAAARRA